MDGLSFQLVDKAYVVFLGVLKEMSVLHLHSFIKKVFIHDTFLFYYFLDICLDISCITVELIFTFCF